MAASPISSRSGTGRSRATPKPAPTISAAYRSTVEDSIYVARAFRGCGVGRALLAALIAESERIDCRTMVAVIAESGSAASVRLHASLGFTPVGILAAVGYKHGRWLDVTLMQRALGPARSAPPTRV